MVRPTTDVSIKDAGGPGTLSGHRLVVRSVERQPRGEVRLGICFFLRCGLRIACLPGIRLMTVKVNWCQKPFGKVFSARGSEAFRKVFARSAAMMIPRWGMRLGAILDHGF